MHVRYWDPSNQSALWFWIWQSKASAAWPHPKIRTDPATRQPTTDARGEKNAARPTVRSPTVRLLRIRAAMTAPGRTRQAELQRGDLSILRVDALHLRLQGAHRPAHVGVKVDLVAPLVDRQRSRAVVDHESQPLLPGVVLVAVGRQPDRPELDRQIIQAGSVEIGDVLPGRPARDWASAGLDLRILAGAEQ